MKNFSIGTLDKLLDEFGGQLQHLRLSEVDQRMIEQSRQAYLARHRLELQEKELDAGYILSESDTSQEEIWARGVGEPLDENGRKVIQKKLASIRRKACRLAKKKVAEVRFLKRRRSKRVGAILRQCPGIGQEIESFVRSCGAGADAWRRTGVLTFDGNRNLQKKPTFKRIKEHLEKTYERTFSYGTVVQFCLPRNKRRRSALRYKGLASVVQKRARKRFNVRYNPDHHWSSALYAALDKLQYTDGHYIMNLGRDDQAGFRLDSTFTHKQHATLCVRGNEPLTTRTDYTNKYLSTLQTSSYNFPATETTGELCAGVVKAPLVHEKNPAQHAADIEHVETLEDLKPAFANPDTRDPKEIECIRVDGSSDEGPSHLEVQYWWTKRHLNKASKATMISSRNSGASYRNRVELQNGCLALAHANMFIPSTLNGSCIGLGGQVDEEMLRKNLASAIEVYISRVDGAPCASTEIHLTTGADSEGNQREADLLKVYLKGSKKKKEKLRQDYPEEASYFGMIWKLRERHLQKNLPLKYVFYLVCCYRSDCIHPVCRQGKPEDQCWYPGGPPLTYVPLPTPDPERPFGNPNCSDCCGLCSGHYMKPDKLWQHVCAGGAVSEMSPPSCKILDAFNLQRDIPDKPTICEVAKDVLLSEQEVTLWFEHVNQIHLNRKSGAEKAARTRREKRREVENVGRRKRRSSKQGSDECSDDTHVQSVP